MKTYYVIRQGWNAANQSSTAAYGQDDDFQTRRLMLVAIVEAETENDAVKSFTGSVYNGQLLFATSNSREYKGLTREIRKFQQREAETY